jgi:hypothetical protein
MPSRREPIGRGYRPTIVRSTSASIGVLAVLALASCGDDSATSSRPESTATLPPAATTAPRADTTAPPADTTAPPTDAGFAHPTGADEIVLRIAFEGGFVPVEVAFVNPPTLIITGDGRVIQPAATTMQYPGPLVPAFSERTISEDGIQAVLALAEEHGMLADVQYASNDNIADAPDTVVTLNVDGQTYEHRAYALGIDGSPEGGESDAARAALFEFVTAVSDLDTAAGPATLGPEQDYQAQAYLIQARPVEGEPEAVEGIEATVVDWPAAAPVRLADATECAEVPAADVAELFGAATQLTYFTEGETTYSLAVTPRLPGRTC